jgi:hypothetical protein
MTDSTIDISTLRWVEAAAGSRMLQYLLSCDDGAAEAVASGEIRPTQKQAEVIELLTSF